MAFWVKLEKRQVTELRDGCVYETHHIGFEWFDDRLAPVPYHVDDTGVIWVNTTDCFFGKDKPIS